MTTKINKTTNPKLNKTIKDEVKRRLNQSKMSMLNKSMPLTRYIRPRIIINRRTPRMPIINKTRYAPGNRFISRATPRIMKNYKDNATLRYYSALLDPEYAVSNKVDCKYPEPYPLPTQTIHIANDWTLSPNSEGKALITWRPYYLTTVDQEKWMADHVLQEYTISNQQAIAGTAHAETSKGSYAQVTVNNDESLSGENMNQNNQFKPMKYVNLPILKYRLIGAKLVIRYNGRSDDEAGSITYGQYTGTLAPVRYGSAQYSYHKYVISQDTLFQADTVTRDAEAWDVSTECGKFGVFDNIRSLPYSNKEPFIKNKKYSFYFYPFDSSSSDFKHIGGYGDIEEVSMISESRQKVGEDYSKNSLVYISRNQLDHSANVTTDVIGNKTIKSNEYQEEDYYQKDILQERPGITVPSYIIALENMTSTESSTISISLYETYEAICSQDMNLVASVSRPNVNINKNQLLNIQSQIMTNPGSNPFSGLQNPAFSNISSINNSNFNNSSISGGGNSLFSQAKRLAKSALISGGKAIGRSLLSSLVA